MTATYLSGDGGRLISAELVFQLITPDAPPVPVRTELCFDSADPYVVQTTFDTGGKPVVWEFARDLLTEGLTGPAGLGDVHIRPHHLDPARVQLELSSPSGRAVFTASAREIGEFLQRTYRATPAGADVDELDLDLELLLAHEELS